MKNVQKKLIMNYFKNQNKMKNVQKKLMMNYFKNIIKKKKMHWIVVIKN